MGNTCGNLTQQSQLAALDQGVLGLYQLLRALLNPLFQRLILPPPPLIFGSQQPTTRQQQSDQAGQSKGYQGCNTCTGTPTWRQDPLVLPKFGHVIQAERQTYLGCAGYAVHYC